MLRCSLMLAAFMIASSSAFAQTALTWAEIRDRFQATNPTLQAGRIGIDESRAAEITAYLRPNPQWSITLDQIGKTDVGRSGRNALRRSK